MNKSESKYLNTALRMDQAFLDLLERKDLEFITIKEICEEAGVNRSTFYLHYETIGDLLAECIKYMHVQFIEHMELYGDDFVEKAKTCSIDELYLVTSEYLTPYLEFIAQHKRLFRAALRNPSTLELDKTFSRMMRHVINPVLERLQIPESDRNYMVTFYIHGLMAIIVEWMKGDCEDSISHVSAVMQQCVMRGRGPKEKTQ